jgi:GDP-L-fucose synthase
MDRAARVCVAGGGTLIGAALRRRLNQQGYPLVGASAPEPEWGDREQVEAFMARTKPTHVFVAAGRSGGIRANQRYPVELMRDNLLVAVTVLDAAWRAGVRKLLYLASSCAYPRAAAQPMRVEALSAGPPEPTNAAYALAKRAGIQLCAAYQTQHQARFVAGIPADVFGPDDDFSAEDSHVLPALLRKVHEARTRGLREVVLWGSGTPRREFLFADDLADACIVVMKAYDGPGPINLGGGTALSIRELAAEVAAVVGYRGTVRFDATQPDGMPVKLLQADELAALDWRPATPLSKALEETYRWFCAREEREAGHAA